MNEPRARKSTEEQRRRLKAAFDTALDMAGGPTSFQWATRVVVGQLSKYSSPNDPLFPPLDVVLDADLKAREPVVLRELAFAEGFAIVKLEPAAIAPSWAEEMGALARETGELLARIGEAAGDGVTRAEAEACLTEAYEAKQRLDQLVARLEAIVRSGSPGG